MRKYIVAILVLLSLCTQAQQINRPEQWYLKKLYALDSVGIGIQYPQARFHSYGSSILSDSAGSFTGIGISFEGYYPFIATYDFFTAAIGLTPTDWFFNSTGTELYSEGNNLYSYADANTGLFSYNQTIIQSTDAWGCLQVVGNDGGEASISLYPNGVTPGSNGSWVWATNGSSMTASQDFAIYNPNYESQPFYISAGSNNVGINTNNPQATLHVYAGEDAPFEIQHYGERQFLTYVSDYSTSIGDLDYDDDGIRFDISDQAHQFSWGWWTDTAMTLTGTAGNPKYLTLNGHLQINDGTQSIGYVLQCDQYGNASWQAPTSSKVVIYADSFAQTGSVSPLISYTPASNGSYEIVFSGQITSITSGTLTTTLAYKDVHGVSQTKTALVNTLTGTVSTQFNITAQSGTPITVSTGFVGTSVLYDLNVTYVYLSH